MTASTRHDGGDVWPGPMVVGVVVTVDLSDLERAPDGFAAVRMRLFERLADLPPGTFVRLNVGRVTPLASTADELPIGHVVVQVESPSFRVAAAWRDLLDGLRA